MSCRDLRTSLARGRGRLTSYTGHDFSAGCPAALRHLDRVADSTGLYDYSGREFPTQDSAYQADLIAFDYSIDEKDSIFHSKYRFAYL